MSSLKGKTAWVTGGKRIGQEIALALAKLGADLVVSYRGSRKEAEEITEKVKETGVKTLIFQCDVASEESVIKTVSEIKQEMGKLDILILLASIFQPVKLEAITEKDWDSNFSTHIKGTFWPIQKSLSLMSPGAHIISVSDRTTLGQIYPGYLPYVVTKSGVSALTRALAVELGSRGIFINSIAPGPILKPVEISEHEWQGIRNQSSIKYPLTDDEAVAEFVETVVRLCSVRSSGSTYPLDLGQL